MKWRIKRYNEKYADEYNIKFKSKKAKTWMDKIYDKYINIIQVANNLHLRMAQPSHL